MRSLESGGAAEYYVTATPGSGVVRRQAGDIYSAVAEHLRETGAFIAQERVFVSAEAMSAVLRARSEALGALDDGVMPTLLATECGAEQAIMGVQVHTVRGPAKPILYRHGERPFARAFAWGDYRYLTASGLGCPRAGDGGVQARCTLETAELLLEAAGGSIGDVARTWIWMENILSWYPELNRVRTGFFKERGVLAGMPASTGVGVSPAGGARVAIDLFAAWGSPDAVERYGALGNQRSAYEYGSAFARAARVRTPAGVTVFCSGTAAIDMAGRTCHAGDGARQIAMTLENVAAVLRDMGCTDKDVVQAMAYCATPAVMEEFGRECGGMLPWPCLSMIGTVCRGDLLFEVEVTACPESRGR